MQKQEVTKIKLYMTIEEREDELRGLTETLEKVERKIDNAIKKKEKVVKGLAYVPHTFTSGVNTSVVEALHSLHAQIHPKSVNAPQQFAGKWGLCALFYNIGRERTLKLLFESLGIGYSKRQVEFMGKKDEARILKRENFLNNKFLSNIKRKQKKQKDKGITLENQIIRKQNKQVIVVPESLEEFFEKVKNKELSGTVPQLKIFLQRFEMKKPNNKPEMELRLKYVLAHQLATSKRNNPQWFRPTQPTSKRPPPKRREIEPSQQSTQASQPSPSASTPKKRLKKARIEKPPTTPKKIRKTVAFNSLFKEIQQLFGFYLDTSTFENLENLVSFFHNIPTKQQSNLTGVVSYLSDVVFDNNLMRKMTYVLQKKRELFFTVITERSEKPSNHLINSYLKHKGEKGFLVLFCLNQQLSLAFRASDNDDVFLISKNQVYHTTMAPYFTILKPANTVKIQIKEDLDPGFIICCCVDVIQHLGHRTFNQKHFSPTFDLDLADHSKDRLGDRLRLKYMEWKQEARNASFLIPDLRFHQCSYVVDHMNFFQLVKSKDFKGSFRSLQSFLFSIFVVLFAKLRAAKLKSKKTSMFLVRKMLKYLLIFTFRSELKNFV